jgi:hypothetical protein
MLPRSAAGQYAVDTRELVFPGDFGFAEPVDSLLQASASRLVDLDATDLTDGTLVFVRTVRDFFRLQKPSTLVPDNITVVAASGGGNWLREMLSDASWLYQATWFLNSSTGDDENDGLTSATSLRTHTELERRWSSDRSKRLEQDTVVTITGNVDNARDAVIGMSPRAGFTLRYVGVPTVQRAATLTAATASNPAANIQQTVTDAAIANWAAHLGQRIELANGAVTGIGLAVSATEALTGYFIIPDAAGTNGSVYTPAGDEAYEVQTVPTFTRGVSVSCPNEGTIVIESMGLAAVTLVMLRRVHFLGCISANWFLQGGRWTQWTSCIWTVGTTLPRSCEYRTIGGLHIGATQATAGLLWVLPPATAGVPHFIVVGGSLNSVWSSRVDGGNERGFGIFNAPGLGVQVLDGACLYSLGVLYGANNVSFPMSIIRGGAYVYATDANRPTIAGVPASQFILGGSGTYLWASDAPAVTSWGGVLRQSGIFGSNPGERKQIGGGTLVDGVAIIGAGGGGERLFITATSSVIVQARGNNGGVAIGKHTVVAVTAGDPGVANFTVNALDLATAVVVTDERDFDWIIVD